MLSARSVLAADFQVLKDLSSLYPFGKKRMQLCLREIICAKVIARNQLKCSSCSPGNHVTMEVPQLRANVFPISSFFGCISDHTTTKTDKVQDKQKKETPYPIIEPPRPPFRVPDRKIMKAEHSYATPATSTSTSSCGLSPRAQDGHRKIIQIGFPSSGSSSTYPLHHSLQAMDRDSVRWASRKSPPNLHR